MSLLRQELPKRDPGIVKKTIPPISRVLCTTPSSDLTFSSANSNLLTLKPSNKAPVNSHGWQYLSRTQGTKFTWMAIFVTYSEYSCKNVFVCTTAIHIFYLRGCVNMKCKITGLCTVTHTVLLTCHLEYRYRRHVHTRPN